MTKAKVAIMMGSKNDLPHLKSGIALLQEFGVPFTVRVISAHRTPLEAAEFASSAADNGIQIILCAAGMAAHLAGVVAAHTTLPVIGMPMASEPFNGLDSLLAMVQMPPGIPVATVTVGKAGGKNAVLFALSILALNDAGLADKLKAFRVAQSEKVRADDAAVSGEYSG